VFADELTQLFGSTPHTVREQAAKAAPEVVNRYLRHERQRGG
jgi:hypothetical protein